MKQLENVKSVTMSHLITIYWDKPEGIESKAEYQIWKDDKYIESTHKTHYTIQELAAETHYKIQIVAIDSQNRWQSEVMNLVTHKEKIRLDITKAPYYAVGDGKTLNTKNIQQALDDCKANQIVYIPEGNFLTGALRMHSNTELYLEENAVLQGTEEIEDYLPRIWSRFEGTELYCYSSLLNLGELQHDGDYNCKNVVIHGKGTIASGGKVLAKRIIKSEREKLKEYLESLGEEIKEYEALNTIPGRVRPRLINMSNCQNIVLAGVKLKNGASWNVHMIYSDDIVTHDCTFYSEEVWNGDGWDPDSSSNCTIFNCTFYTGDDSIAIKSGKNPEGNEINRPSEHIRIFDCKTAFGHGITIGSEMSGGINDVRIWDCDMGSSLSGIEIKGTKKRGGYVKNISVRDCVTSRVLFHSVTYNDDGIGALVPPIFENCLFERVCILGEYYDHERRWVPCHAIELCGFDEEGYEIRHIIFRDIVIGSRGENKHQTILLQLCNHITFEGISVKRIFSKND